MKSKLVLILLVFSMSTINAEEKAFVEKLYELRKTDCDGMEMVRIPTEMLLDSLQNEAAARTGEELAKVQRQIAEVENYKAFLCLVAANFLQDSKSDVSMLANEMDSLLSGYEELLMVRKDQSKGRIFVKSKNDKVSEVIIWWFEHGFMSSSEKEVFSMNMDVVLNIPYKKPVPLEELIDQFGEKEVEGSFKGMNLFENPLQMFGVRVNMTMETTTGKWLDEDTKAKAWKVRSVGEQYGLYDEAGKEILPPEYEGIEHFHGFLSTDSSTYSMFILGFSITKENKKGYVDLNGRIVFPPEYDDVKHFEQDQSRYMLLFRNNKQGLADALSGELLIPIEYDNIIWRGDYLELVKENAIDRIAWDRERAILTGEILVTSIGSK